MSWYYQVRKRIVDGSPIYDIVERYGRDMWTAQSMSPLGETKAEVIRDLERMLADAKKNPILYEERQRLRKMKEGT
jgi:hypothetical protein